MGVKVTGAIPFQFAAEEAFTVSTSRTDCTHAALESFWHTRMNRVRLVYGLIRHTPYRNCRRCSLSNVQQHEEVLVPRFFGSYQQCLQVDTETEENDKCCTVCTEDGAQTYKLDMKLITRSIENQQLTAYVKAKILSSHMIYCKR